LDEEKIALTQDADNKFNEYVLDLSRGQLRARAAHSGEIRSLTKLVAYLMRTYQITPDRVMPQGTGKATIPRGT